MIYLFFKIYAYGAFCQLSQASPSPLHSIWNIFSKLLIGIANFGVKLGKQYDTYMVIIKTANLVHGDLPFE